MKVLTTVLVLCVACSTTSFAQTDAEGCKEHPMFPDRMPNYFLSECSDNFDAVEFNLAPGGRKMITKEGTKILRRHDFNPESGQNKPSPLQILRNYEAAVKKIGGLTVYLNAGEGLGTFKIMKGGKEVAWVKLELGGDGGNDFYLLIILQLEEMKQEISSNDILTALNTDGRIALYINFETGKSEIKPESQNIVDQIAEMLKANESLKISVEGHTDNAGTPASNKTLSENRARSVVNGLVAKGISASRVSAKGWGQDKPISENNSDEGKAKNRRVEIVKM